MNIRPIKDQVVVLPDPAPKVNPGGVIVIPDAVGADNPNYYTMTGRVVALGRCAYIRDTKGEIDSDEMPFAVAIGDRVLFNRYAGKQVTSPDDGVLYLVMEEGLIMGVVEGEHLIQPGYMPADDTGIKSLPMDAPL